MSTVMETPSQLDKKGPHISITSPTPPRPPESTSTYRLLYRGALSLPDSHLLLDGLTFSARLDANMSPQKLMENPLALALESMRGRPCLRFLGTVPLKDVWMDESGGIEMDIHPYAMLSQIYFENTFCLRPLLDKSRYAPLPELPETGIKVALGDSDGPETTTMIIAARPFPTTSHSPSTTSQPLQLLVARQVTHPIHQTSRLRLPRPDDPISRKPPLVLQRSGEGSRTLKRIASTSTLAAPSGRLTAGAKRQRISSGSTLPSELGSGVRLGSRPPIESAGSFRIPEAPSKGKERALSSVRRNDTDDVFGGMPVGKWVAATSDGTEKAKRNNKILPAEATSAASEIENTNKNVIKKAAHRYLKNRKHPTHPEIILDAKSQEFKELYGWVQRGVGFALRHKLKLGPLDLPEVDQLVDMHVKMYIPGYGLTFPSS